MAWPSVEEDVATALQSASPTVGNYSASGTKTIFTGPPRPADATNGPPTAAVFVQQYGGGNVPYLNGGAKSWRTPRVQVTVRSGREDYDGGVAKARAVRAALHLASLTGYTFCFADDPTPIGRDAEDCWRWTVNCRLGIKI